MHEGYEMTEEVCVSEVSISSAKLGESNFQVSGGLV